MIRKADTMGKFQIESRDQMSMLPRLKPGLFMILSLKSPSCAPPIQGDMVHPYTR
jgi:error-prone DNA polymerase